MQQMTLPEMQEVSGAGGKLDPGGFGDALQLESEATDEQTDATLNKASPKLFL